MKRFLRLLLFSLSVLTLFVMLSCFLSVSAETDGILKYYVDNGKACVTDLTNKNIEGKVIIPSKLGGCPVTNISPVGFNRCMYVTEFVLPDSLENIGDLAFMGCMDLTRVDIPSSVTRIGNKAFSECLSLREISVPDTVKYIGKEAFFLTEWYYNQPDGVLYLGNCAYAIKGKTDIDLTVKDGTKRIMDYAFGNNNQIKSVVIPDSVTDIGMRAFENCVGLTSVVLPRDLTSIAVGLFDGCKNLENVTIPPSVTSIEGAAFMGCSSVTEAVIPDSVTKIGKNAFSNCKNLKSVTIPDSVKTIGSKAFENCDELTVICKSGSQAEQFCKTYSISYETTGLARDIITSRIALAVAVALSVGALAAVIFLPLKKKNKDEKNSPL